MVTSLHQVEGYYGEDMVTPLLKKDTDLYFLGGIPKEKRIEKGHKRSVTDHDVIAKTYMVFDFDVRKSHEGITNEEIISMAQGVGEMIKSHPILGGWTAIVYSGNGFHVYYTTKTPRYVSPLSWKKRYLSIASLFNVYPIIQPDQACSNSARIFRLPYSKNTKHTPSLTTAIVAEQTNPTDEVFSGLSTQEPDQMGLSTFRERVKEYPIKTLCDVFGYTVNSRNHIVIGEKETSITINEQGNYVNRFSGKPGSGSFIHLYSALENVPFLEACQAISLKLFGQGIEPSKQERYKLKQVERAKKPYKPLSWNTPIMDTMFPPIKPYSYVVLSGETKSGKSTVAFDMCVKNASQGRHIVYVTLEMSAEQLIDNVGRSAAGITPVQERYKMEHGTYQGTAETVFNSTVSRINKIETLHIIGRTPSKPMTINDIFDMVMDYDEVDLLVIDNLDKVDNVDRQTDFDKQKEVSKRILEFTNAYYIPTILVHHLRKPMDEKRQKWRTVDALSGTSKISHDAHMVVMVSRDRTDDGAFEDSATYIRVAETREFSPCLAKVYLHNGVFQDDNPVPIWARFPHSK